MTFQLNHLYYVFQKTFFKRFLINFGCALLIGILFFKGWNTSPSFWIVPLIFLIVLNASSLSHLPMQFTLSDGKITTCMWIKTLNEKEKNPFLIRRGAIRSNQPPTHKQVTLSICDITEIEIERFGRHAGMLRLHGHITAYNSIGNPATDVICPRYVEFYGVQNFEAALKEIQTAFPTANITEPKQRRAK